VLEVFVIILGKNEYGEYKAEGGRIGSEIIQYENNGGFGWAVMQ